MGDKSKLAFLGMGIMGASMASNLARAGYDVSVWNRSSGRPGMKQALEAGCMESDSIATCVSEADFVFTCLGDVQDVEQVILGESGVSASAKPGAVVVDFSTIGPKSAEHIFDELAGSELKFLDAPITGGDVGALNGTLTIMVGGEESAFKAALPYLQKMGSTVKHCGPAGSGQALKLCNQVLCAVTMSAVSESICLAKRFGLDPSLVVEVLKDGAGGSWALSNLGTRIVKDDLKPGFMLKHMIKDLRLIHENCQSDDLQLPAMEMAEGIFKELVRKDPAAAESLGTQAMIKAYGDD